MALQIPQMPNFTAQTPDILGAQQKQATLSQMLNANALQKQLAPLQVQEQQEKAKAATLQNQVTQEDLNNQVARRCSKSSRTARPCTRWTKRQRRTLMQKTTSFYLYSSNWTTPLSNQIA